MTVFEWLIAAHLVGDWLLQTSYQVTNKDRGRWLNRALLTHCAAYTLCIAAVLWAQNISPWWLTWVFVTHAVLDYRRPVEWWRRVVTRNTDAPLWLIIVTDQVFHVLVLVIVAAMFR